MWWACIKMRCGGLCMHKKGYALRPRPASVYIMQGLSGRGYALFFLITMRYGMI